MKISYKLIGLLLEEVLNNPGPPINVDPPTRNFDKCLEAVEIPGYDYADVIQHFHLMIRDGLLFMSDGSMTGGVKGVALSLRGYDYLREFRKWTT